MMGLCKSELATRPLLYTDSIKGAQVCRDDMWAVTTEELNRQADRIRELEAERQQVREALACGPENLVEWAEKAMRAVRAMESELAALRQQQTFAWNALDSAMIKDHDRTGSLAESITRLAMERDDLRQQQGEPVAVVRENPDDYGTIIESTGTVNLQPGERLYREAAPKQQGEPVAIIKRNSAGQIHIVGQDGDYFDMSKHVGVHFYREAAPRVPEGWKLVPVEPVKPAGVLTPFWEQAMRGHQFVLAAAPRVPDGWQKTPSEIISDAMSVSALEHPDEWLSVTATFRQNTSGIGVIDDLCIRVAAPEPKE